MNSPTYYTRQTLAETCGITVCMVDRHARRGTLRLDKAREKVPDVGVVFKAGLAERFVAAMRAKHGHSIQKPDPNGRTLTIQLTEADADRLVTALQALTAALLAGRE